MSLILVNVTSSGSGLYTARVINADNQVFEETLTLVVNKAPVSSSPAPPHSSSPKPPRSSDLHWTVIVIPVVVITLVIIISGGVCFWKLRKKCKRAAEEEEATETPAVSRSRSNVSTRNNNCKNHCSNCVSVAMNGCGENAEVLLPSKNTLTV